MPKTRRNRMTKHHNSQRNTKKVYGADRYEPYAIHKITMISYDPLESCRSLKKIFGNAMSDIQTPPDKALKERERN